MKVSLASDHAGFAHKQIIKDHLVGEGYEVIDRGPNEEARVDYPDYAALVAHDVSSGFSQRGVLVCGTGIGMAIAANKIEGIRAANVTEPDFAALARQHNDLNVITVSGRFIDAPMNLRIVDAFLGADFQGGRHADRIQKISELESK